MAPLLPRSDGRAPVHAVTAGTVPEDERVMSCEQAADAVVGLVSAATSGRPEDWARWATWLGARSGRELLLLDGEARSWRRSGQAPARGVRGWLGERLDEPTGLVAAVTSWHADGRFRQRATQVLAARGGALAATALAVRCLDHVPQVRADALAGLRGRTSGVEAVAVLGVLAAGQRRQHAQEALAVLSDGLAQRQDLAELLVELCGTDDPALRRWAFAHAQARGLLGVDELVAAVRGPDQFVRAAAVTALQGRRAPTGQLLLLLGGRYVGGRVLAVQELPDEALGDGVLLPLLADRSRRVRELAQWRARRRGHDVAGWYRGRLREDELGPARRAACLDGLAGCGGAPDVELVASSLAHGSPRVRTQAVLTTAAVAPSDVVCRLLLPLLEDPAPRVSAAVARALSTAGASAADAESAWASAQPATRRAAWRLSRAAGRWERVDADVRAASDPDPVLAGLGRAGLRSWLHAGAATTWGRPAPEAAQRLQAALQGAGLTDAEQRQVLFHAGLPVPASARAPDEDRGPAPPRRGLRLLRRR